MKTMPRYEEALQNWRNHIGECAQCRRVDELGTILGPAKDEDCCEVGQELTRQSNKVFQIEVPPYLSW